MVKIKDLIQQLHRTVKKSYKRENKLVEMKSPFEGRGFQIKTVLEQQI